MNPTTAVFVIVLSFAVSCYGQIPQLTGYDQIVNVSGTLEDNGLNVTNQYYVIYYSILLPNIHIGIVCQTDDWCAIGFSTTGLMVGLDNGTVVPSDAAVGYINSTGSPIVLDFVLGGRLTSDNCPSQTAVCPDTASTVAGCENDVTVIDGGRAASGNYIWFEFVRPVAASDVCDVAIPTNGSHISLLYSSGPFLDGLTFPFNLDQHDARAPSPAPNHTFVLATTTATTTGRFTTGQATTGQSTTGQSTTGRSTTGHATTAAATTGAVSEKGGSATLSPMFLSFVFGGLFIGLFVYFRFPSHEELLKTH